MTVVGRYFASGHVGSELPPAYHGRLATFGQWLSNEAGLRSSKAVAAPADSTVEQFSKSVVENLQVLGELAGNDRLVVLLIDGADPEGPVPTEFIHYLPNTLPPGPRGRPIDHEHGGIQG